MKSLVSAALLSSAALVSACGGGGSAIDTTGEPTVVSQGLNTGNLQPGEVGRDTFTFVASDGSEVLVYLRNNDFDKGAIWGYINEDSVVKTWNDVAAYGETFTGAGTASYITSTEDGLQAAATFLERVGTTEVPTSGTPSFEGDYSGVIYYVTVGDPVESAVIHGDAALDANFDFMTISGTISNRTDLKERTYADVSFVESDISDGAFGGTATGGATTTDGSTSSTSNGNYSGLLTGDIAGEVVGSVYLERIDTIRVDPEGNDVLQSRFERGIFIAEQPVP